MDVRLISGRVAVLTMLLATTVTAHSIERRGMMGMSKSDSKSKTGMSSSESQSGKMGKMGMSYSKVEKKKSKKKGKMGMSHSQSSSETGEDKVNAKTASPTPPPTTAASPTPPPTTAAPIAAPTALPTTAAPTTAAPTTTPLYVTPDASEMSSNPFTSTILGVDFTVQSDISTGIASSNFLSMDFMNSYPEDTITITFGSPTEFYILAGYWRGLAGGGACGSNCVTYTFSDEVEYAGPDAAAFANDFVLQNGGTELVVDGLYFSDVLKTKNAVSSFTISSDSNGGSIQGVTFGLIGSGGNVFPPP